jgi:HCOMODA/2-hydroxy-3-carboxy-muconic semialdehyde decarboxylase
MRTGAFKASAHHPGGGIMVCGRKEIGMAESVRRREFMALLAMATPGVLGFSPLSALAAQSASAAPNPEILRHLVAGNHILVRKNVIVIHGHLSVRHDKNPNRFFMSKAIAPEQIVPDDIMEFDLDSKAIDPKGRMGYMERFIHSELYRARPEVNAVVHAHTPSLLPFTVSDIPLQPVSQQTTWMPARVKMHKNGEQGDTIVNIQQGQAMVKTMGRDTALLLHGHGVVVVGNSIPTVVGRCIELELNGRIQRDVMAMGGKMTPLPVDDPPRGGGFGRGWDAWLAEEMRLVK